MALVRLFPKEFPPLLSHIPDPPQRLYLRGSFPDASHVFLAVVGSRSCTSYGKEVTRFLIKSLKGYPVVIVSGLAFGIDSFAHRCALEVGLTTVAVLGSGVDSSVIAPRTHVSLAHEIIQSGGCILSEYEPHTRSEPWYFPERNRIMAGISHAVLIIEATEKSGTLITARLAMEYNRDVLAVPGSILSDHSYGPHILIRDGAVPITSPDNLFEALHSYGLRYEHTKHAPIDNLSGDEAILVSLLYEPRSKDDLIRETGYSINHLNSLISLLEIRKIITKDSRQMIHRALR